MPTYIYIYIMCIQPLEGMIQASPQIQDEGPLEHFGGPPNKHLQVLQKTQTGSTIYINHFFHLFSAAAMLQHLSDVSEPTWDTAGNAGKAEVWDRFDTAFQH